MISSLKVEIEPWMYPNSNTYELRVRVYFDGQIYGYQQVMPFDVMQSVFDQIWEHAGRQIREKIIEASNDRSSKV